MQIIQLTDLPVYPATPWCLPISVGSFLTSLCQLFLAELEGSNYSGESRGASTGTRAGVNHPPAHLKESIALLCALGDYRSVTDVKNTADLSYIRGK